MNINDAERAGSSWGFSRLAIAAAVLLSCTIPSLCPARPFDSPVGQVWDCVLLGSTQRGVAFLNFTTDPDSDGNYTFEIVQVQTPSYLPKLTFPPASGGRNPNGDGGRTHTNTPPVNTNTVVGTTNIYGYVQASGSWAFDYQGNVVGFYYNTVEFSDGTVLTNHVNFTARVVANRRLTAAVRSSVAGHMTLRGVPQQPLLNRRTGSDFSGRWSGLMTFGGYSSVELFTLTPIQPFSGCDNTYVFNGSGPGYGTTGFGLISAQRWAGFGVTEQHGTNFVVRAGVGPFQNTRLGVRAATRGTRFPGSAAMIFKAWPQPNILPPD